MEAAMTELSYIETLVANQRQFFSERKTYDFEFRKRQLNKLASIISDEEKTLTKALKEDLGKCQFEAYAGEVGFVLGDIAHSLKHLKSWMRPVNVKTPLLHFPVKSYIQPNPFGVVAIIGPWNYPVQLIFSPLVGSIAAGNTTILKPSELAPATSELITRLINDNFSESYIGVIEGAVKETQGLLDQKLDYIFYTGSTHVGRIVMEKASKHLSPVTLELGGKSPCVVYDVEDIEMAAKRVVWGKFFNTGQTCIAPDYCLVEKGIASQFTSALEKAITEFYSADPIKSKDYGRIINERHFDRLESLIDPEKVLFGGNVDKSQKYISPTVVKSDGNDKVMEEEIFGPILPIIEIENVDEATNFIGKRSRPLALYIFSQNEEVQEKVLTQTHSGGVCINDILVHISTPDLPFGGIGDSGMGAYHGKYSFDTFSHKRSVMKRYLKMDISLRYPPYFGKMKMLKWALKKFS